MIDDRLRDSNLDPARYVPIEDERDADPVVYRARLAAYRERSGDDATGMRVQTALGEKDLALGSGTAEMPDWFSKSRTERRSRGDRVILRIPMGRVYTWDFSKVRKHYEKPRNG